METKEYIESGILELYAAGALSQDEAVKVETMAHVHPDVAAELIEIKNSLSGYASAFERNPRPPVRHAIMEKISKKANPNGDKIRNSIPDRVPVAASLTYKYLLAACLASLVISTFASYFFYNRWSESEDKNMVLLNEKNVLAQNYSQVKNAFDKTFSDMLVMRDINVKMFSLQCPDSAKDFAAHVYWNSRTNESFLDVQDLPMPEPGKQYQLWALVDGTPVDAGVFDMGGEEGLHRMKSMRSAEGWAVTLEPMGGSVVPTMSSMYLISKG